MRWAVALVAVGLFAVVVVVGVLSSVRSGGDTRELVGRIEVALEKFGFPEPLRDCMGRRLEASLNNNEIERLYDSPRGVNQGTKAVASNPKVERAIVRSGKACILWLEKSGRMSRKQLIRAIGGLGELS